VPITEELLAILCCPVTKVPVRMLGEKELAQVNEQITKGAVKSVDGSKVDKQLSEGLITTDKKTIYRIDEDIPVMLADVGIPVDQFDNL
jgi:uncharacterized protein YbaR (Trm112 family)